MSEYDQTLRQFQERRADNRRPPEKGDNSVVLIDGSTRLKVYIRADRSYGDHTVQAMAVAIMKSIRYLVRWARRGQYVSVKLLEGTARSRRRGHRGGHWKPVMTREELQNGITENDPHRTRDAGRALALAMFRLVIFSLPVGEKGWLDKAMGCLGDES